MYCWLFGRTGPKGLCRVRCKLSSHCWQLSVVCPSLTLRQSGQWGAAGTLRTSRGDITGGQEEAVGAQVAEELTVWGLPTMGRKLDFDKVIRCETKILSN